MRRFRFVAALAVGIALAAALGFQDGSSSSSTAATPAERFAARGLPGGAVPEGATPFDDRIPGIANLDPELLGALREAAVAASQEGVELLVNSGWRSPAYQERLLREAISEYGSETEAARWVARPGVSTHVSADAVDIGPPAAADWLAARSAQFGLCRVYANEPWHFELRPEAIGSGCPPAYADPTQDPRMQR